MLSVLDGELLNHRGNPPGKTHPVIDLKPSAATVVGVESELISGVCFCCCVAEQGLLRLYFKSLVNYNLN